MFLAENSSQKQHIEQLIRIQLDLEECNIDLSKFVQIPNSKDPLDDILSTLKQKDQQIFKLKWILQKIKQKQPDLHTKILKFSNQSEYHQFVKCLEKIQRDFQNIIIQEPENQVKEKFQQLKVFLIKVLKDISCRSLSQNDTIQIRISLFEQLLKMAGRNQKSKQFDRIQRQNKGECDYEISLLKKEANQKERFSRIYKQLQSQKQEQIFSSLHKKLGLQQKWSNYLAPLKQSHQILQTFKNCFFQKVSIHRSKEQELTYGQNIEIMEKVSEILYIFGASQKQKNAFLKFKTYQYFNPQTFIMNYLKEQQKFQNQNLQKQIKALQTIQHIFRYFLQNISSLFDHQSKNPIYSNISDSNLEHENIAYPYILPQKIISAKQEQDWSCLKNLLTIQIDYIFRSIKKRMKSFSCSRISFNSIKAML